MIVITPLEEIKNVAHYSSWRRPQSVTAISGMAVLGTMTTITQADGGARPVEVKTAILMGGISVTFTIPIILLRDLTC